MNKINQKLLWILTITNAFWLCAIMIVLLYLVVFKYPKIEENLRNEYRNADQSIISYNDSCGCEPYLKQLQDFVNKENQKLHDFVNESLGY